MPYDRSLEPPYVGEENATFGNRCKAITASDSVDAVDTSGRYFKYITAATAGNVSVLGYTNEDGDAPVVYTMSAGMIIPGRIRRVLSTGTTATVVGWSD